MRLIRITTNHPTYLKQFYAQRPELKEETYSVQYQALMADCFCWADFLPYALSKLGYEVWGPVGNAEPMQKAWAQENGVSYDRKSWKTDIITAQIKNFRPDIVLVYDHHSHSADFLKYLRSECSFIQLMIVWCGSPYSDISVFKPHDLVLSNITSIVDYLRDNGHRCEYMCHAFDPRVLDKINCNSEEKIAFSFAGSIYKGSGLHNQRQDLLNNLVRETNLHIWSDISPISQQELIILPLKQGVYDLMQFAKSTPGLKSLIPTIPKIKNYANRKRRPGSQYVDAAIAERSQPALFGISMYQKFYESQITLNTHIDISSEFASNMRLYEATGVGTCLLTDWKKNLHELFEPDVEVVTYKSAEEAVEKVHYLLAHDDERRKIAAAGQRRTLHSHNFDIRAQQLHELIRSFI